MKQSIIISGGGVARHLIERTKAMPPKPAQSLLFVALSALLGVGCGERAEI